MNKVEEIFKSWGISINPNTEQSKLASDRIQICNTCEHKKEGIINTCNVCGCSLRAKVFSPMKGACPIGKWDGVDENISKYNHMKQIRYICCQPASLYYTWQVEVLIQNFKKMGVNPNYIDIVCGTEDGKIPEDWSKLMNHYNTVRFFFYKDTREDKTYHPSIYFNLMKQHIVARPEIQNDILFLHDSDIVLTKPPKFDAMKDGDSWYISDTTSYIGYKYLEQKGIELYYNKMCEIVGIDPKIPKLLNHASGGAQYIVKNTTSEFWNKVERDSINLYKYFCKVEHLYVKKTEYDYPIQKWTAGMWSLLWNAWLAGHETIVDDRLSFGWVTGDISEVEKYPILHNSGVTLELSQKNNLFIKSNYTNKLPYGENLNINPNYASYYYWQQIEETSKNSVIYSNKLKSE
jgi:hypothetical protein